MYLNFLPAFQAFKWRRVANATDRHNLRQEATVTVPHKLPIPPEASEGGEGLETEETSEGEEATTPFMGKTQF